MTDQEASALLQEAREQEYIAKYRRAKSFVLCTSCKGAPGQDCRACLGLGHVAQVRPDGNLMFHWTGAPYSSGSYGTDVED